jgi:hypothetical protein
VKILRARARARADEGRHGGTRIDDLDPCNLEENGSEVRDAVLFGDTRSVWNLNVFRDLLIELEVVALVRVGIGQEHCREARDQGGD